MFSERTLAYLRELFVDEDAVDALAELDAGFDAVFVDADKEPLETCFREAMRVLRVGGLLLCDNAVFHERVVDATDKAGDVEGVRAFNRLAAEDPRLCATVIPVRDRFLAGVKLAD